jgi:hypothetical protein
MTLLQKKDVTGADNVLAAVKAYAKLKGGAVTVGVIGYPNTGKKRCV